MENIGNFINFLLTYKGRTPDDQAILILQKAQALIDSGSKGVLITYSANYGQTQKINNTYENGQFDTGTNGANQAAVIAHMETLLRDKPAYSSLQLKMRIAPITTMTYSGYGDKTHKQIVEEDLAHIKNQLNNGWDVLGWINEGSNPEYAVGGGVASSSDPDNPGQIRFPKTLQKIVQATLNKYAAEYVAEYADG